MENNKNRQGLILFIILTAITLPLLLGAGLISEKEKIILAILSILLFILYIFRAMAALNFILFLSLFLAAFLSGKFIYFEKIDIAFFQAALLIIFFILTLRESHKEDRSAPAGRPPEKQAIDNFSLGLMVMAAGTFLLSLLVNRAILGFYLDFWIDLKRHWPVFLFGLTYFIVRGKASRKAMAGLTFYFMGLFIITLMLSFFKFGENKDLAVKKVKYNLAFFYKDTENWQEKRRAFRRGLVYEYLGLWPKARAEFAKVVLSSPQDKEAHFNLARSYLAEELWYEAILEYRRVIELEPDFPGSHYGLAKAYEALGLKEQAKEEFLKEMETNRREIRAYLALEEFYRKEGLVKEAERIKTQRLQEITTFIDGKDISDANLKIMPAVLNGGSVTVEVVARGTYAHGFWPRMEVWLSKAGTLERGGEAWVRAGEWKSYYFHFKTRPGEEKLIVHYINDFYGGPDNDRNLYIKRINFIYSK